MLFNCAILTDCEDGEILLEQFTVEETSRRFAVAKIAGKVYPQTYCIIRNKGTIFAEIHNRDGKLTAEIRDCVHFSVWHEFDIENEDGEFFLAKKLLTPQ